MKWPAQIIQIKSLLCSLALALTMMLSWDLTRRSPAAPRAKSIWPINRISVDAEGNTNAGLEPTGDPSGSCSSSTGQIYVRGGTSGDYYALMYSWYFPKDEPSTGLGHRHDWEGVIVWLSDSTSTSADNIVAVCPSAHGGWDCSTDGYTLDGTTPLIQYYSVWPVNHQCGLTTTVGGTQPLIAWESLPTAASTALEDTDFGDANVPFKDANFSSNLEKATF
ncbi:hypothetical protein AO1008_10935 [Aspergillus oryzae 100-8]|uniref:NPP1 domain protein n=1 Tax=Aspergillus oryzae (strain 3.042) TaxID=1160506 RepID=I8U7U7_ASPO3|nr:hypothetical protein Ao3042_11929 [Aspergillus oryzae 3.042]KDE84333.1 hypothetical protein AO1008_10935 [Aspergillus oryzae 100-8]|eukprot:EIT82833.1 hypothetical protein Ao3042_11929 [Aspergillus oryzae 3.042]